MRPRRTKINNNKGEREKLETEAIEDSGEELGFLDFRGIGNRRC